MKEFIYTIEHVSNNDSRLEEYQRAQVTVSKKPWAVCINGRPQVLYRSEYMAKQHAKRLASISVTGQVRKLEVQR